MSRQAQSYIFFCESQLLIARLSTGVQLTVLTKTFQNLMFFSGCLSGSACLVAPFTISFCAKIVLHVPHQIWFVGLIKVMIPEKLQSVMLIFHDQYVLYLNNCQPQWFLADNFYQQSDESGGQGEASKLTGNAICAGWQWDRGLGYSAAPLNRRGTWPWAQLSMALR